MFPRNLLYIWLCYKAHAWIRNCHLKSILFLLALGHGFFIPGIHLANSLELITPHIITVWGCLIGAITALGKLILSSNIWVVWKPNLNKIFLYPCVNILTPAEFSCSRCSWIQTIFWHHSSSCLFKGRQNLNLIFSNCCYSGNHGLIKNV